MREDKVLFRTQLTVQITDEDAIDFDWYTEELPNIERILEALRARQMAGGDVTHHQTRIEVIGGLGEEEMLDAIAAHDPTPALVPGPYDERINNLERGMRNLQRQSSDIAGSVAKIAEMLSGVTGPKPLASSKADIVPLVPRRAAVEDVGAPDIGDGYDDSAFDPAIAAAAAAKGFPLVGGVSPRSDASTPIKTGRRDRAGVTPEMTSGRMQVVGPGAGSVIMTAGGGFDDEGNPKIVEMKRPIVGDTLHRGTNLVDDNG